MKRWSLAPFNNFRKRKSQWFIYLTFSSPDVIQGHWAMACSNGNSVTPFIIADHVEPEWDICTTTTKAKARWDCLHMEDRNQYTQRWIHMHVYVYESPNLFMSSLFPNKYLCNQHMEILWICFPLVLSTFEKSSKTEPTETTSLLMNCRPALAAHSINPALGRLKQEG